MSFFIRGKNKLSGEIIVETSKNALLPIMAASILADSPVTLLNVPKFSDIVNMCEILNSLGAKINWIGDNLTIDPRTINTTEIDKQLSQKIRASIFLIGPLCAKYKSATTFMPGGCKIGNRPIDIHLSGLEHFGTIITQKEDKISLDAKNYIGGQYRLKIPSVGATENLIMSAVLNKNRAVVIKNCAKEPEIVDLCNFLTKLGAKIKGIGTSELKIIGVNKLNGTTYKAIGDRIIAGTYLVACAMCGGKLKLVNANIYHNKRLITILSKLGCLVVGNSDNIYIVSNVLKNRSISIKTKPYPGFATDLQSQLVSLLAMVNGKHKVEETLFENRFNQVPELIKMGAKITILGKVAIIYGKNDCYFGSSVCAKDLRGGASLVLAGMASRGNTSIDGTEYIDRGYENLEEKLSSIGADIHRK